MLTLNLLVLRCADIEKSRAFYELFGMTFVKHTHGKGPEHYAFENGEIVFELYAATCHTKDEMTGLGFRVEEFAQKHEMFVEKGYVPSAIKQNPWGLSFVLRDPDGRRVEIQE